MNYLFKYVFTDDTTQNYILDITTISCRKAKKLVDKAIKSKSFTIVDTRNDFCDYINDPNTSFVDYPCHIENEIEVFDEE